MRLRPSFRAALLLALCFWSCSKRQEPGWLHLSEVASLELESEATEQGFVWRDRTYRVVERAGFSWLSTDIARADWAFRPRVHGGSWMARVPISGTGRPPDASVEQRLSAGDVTFEHSGPDLLFDQWTLETQGFHALGDRVFLKLEPGAEPPESARLEVFAHRRSEDGGRLRVQGKRFSGDGFALWPGERMHCELPLLESSQLSFATAVEPAWVGDKAGGEVVFRVALDGQSVWSYTAGNASEASIRSHALDIPRGGTRLSFSVDGALAYASFINPTLRPAGVAAAKRPDIIVFLADTFRADNMQTYGGEGELTPYLDALAERSLTFEEARSTSTYTLPAHTSMFAGVYPHQVGIVGLKRALPGAWITLAEHLSRGGYRTGAITESVIVSKDYGLDQGFEWWDEARCDLEQTLERTKTFLEADDGRPFFLFVQTYRTHVPYIVSERSRKSLGLTGEWSALHEELVSALDAQPRDDERVTRLTAAIQSHYRGTAIDLDQGFKAFHEDLLARGFDGHLLFTSDHGEAFFEHDEIYHPGKVYEELVRVPFFLHGPGIEARLSTRPVSLIDLAPTIVDLAHVEGGNWPGRSVLHKKSKDAIYLFECRPHPTSTYGIVDGSCKLIGFERSVGDAQEGIFAAFDLEDDPTERVDLSSSESWPAGFVGKREDRVKALMRPLIDPLEAALDQGKMSELRGMGYTGD